ncbi:hypothetical protein CDL12_18457 [Handroanthus impetiginosus]|uniref:Uncharacterized protein n=1 Tax=Handroanthus impetiginosus TaxID=429701 RepID=A0A2G9GUK8_9LAMI|nr:hypothetical protein CDL12_18457 [Handroanthus impetiginosus]
MLQNCPNHDIPRHIQVHTFYHRLTDGGKDKLDHLNGDSFLSGTTAECHNLLNNLVANHYKKKSERATPSKAAEVIEVDQVTTLNVKIDSLMQSMKNFGVNQVQHTPITCEECGEGHSSDQCSHSVESIQFASNARKSQNNPYSNTYNFGWRQHPNFSWNNNQGQRSALKFQQGVQQQVQQPMQEKKPSLEETLMQFMASTIANFKTMETKIDCKVQCQAATLRNGRELQEVVKETAKAKGDEFLEIFKKLHNNIPFAKAIEQMSSYVKFMKDILSKKKRLGDYETVALTEECSVIIQNKLLLKLKDPGSFTIPYTIGTHFSGRGVIEDILVKVNKFIFPADFTVLYMEVDSEIPIILGRPFLATGRTLINVQKGELTMRVQDQQITFNVFKAMKFPNESDECFSIVKTLDTSKFFKSRGVESLERTAPSKVLKPSIEEPPTLELKPLPSHLYYAYLGESDTLSVIISSSLSDLQIEKLLRILLEYYQKSSMESQRRLNPIMKEVVKKEIIKWLDAGIIYPISDS